MPKGQAIDDAGQKAMVREALDALLAWDDLRRSPLLAAFLRYVVEARLEGRADAIKAYAIAIDVFDRPQDFDPQSDPIVRVQARRLRALLKVYYDRHGPQSGVRIELPVGSYVPRFAFFPAANHNLYAPVPEAAPKEDAGGGEPRGRARGIWLSLVSLVLLVGVIAWPALIDRDAVVPVIDQPLAPLVIVEEFENLTEDRIGSPLAAGLALEMVTSLNVFPDLVARYGGARAALLEEEDAAVRPVYVLSGVVRRVGTEIQYDAILTDIATDSVAAAFDVSVGLDGGSPVLSLTEIAHLMVLGIASPRAPVHAQARAWLADAEAEDGDLALYPCLVQFALYREEASGTNRQRTEACALGLADDAGSRSHALAILSRVSADRAWQAGIATPEGDAALDLAYRRAEMARDLMPLDAFGWAQLAYVSAVSGELSRAREQLGSALQLNPASVEIVAGMAQIESRLGNWNVAVGLSERAFSAEPLPPDWYYGVPALRALRDGDYRAAQYYGERLIHAEPELGVAVLVASAGLLRDASAVNATLPRLLAMQSFRQMGILPTLRMRIRDPDLLRILSNGISHAGVSLDRLLRASEPQ